MNAPRWLLPVVAGALLIAGIAATVSSSHAGVEARLARQATSQALKDASHAASVAASAQHQADQFRIERDSAVARASHLAAKAAATRAAYTVAKQAAPDTCLPVIITADSALAASDSLQRELHVALTASENSEHALQIAVDTLQAGLTKLRSASAALVSADTKLAHRTLFAKLVPHLGGGIAIGLDATGAPHLITGVTLGWSF